MMIGAICCVLLPVLSFSLDQDYLGSYPWGTNNYEERSKDILSALRSDFQLNLLEGFLSNENIVVADADGVKYRFGNPKSGYKDKEDVDVILEDDEDNEVLTMDINGDVQLVKGSMHPKFAASKSMKNKPNVPTLDPRMLAVQTNETALRESLHNVCLTYPDNWWNYEWCHRKEVMQFHFEGHETVGFAAQGGNGAGLKRNPQFSLGKYHHSTTVRTRGDNKNESAQIVKLIDTFVGGQYLDETGGNRRSHVNIQCCAGGFGSNGNKIATKEDTVDANINEGENENDKFQNWLNSLTDTEVQQLGYEREDDALMSKLYIADILPTTLNDKATTSRQFELMMVDEDEDWSDMEEVLDEHGSRLGMSITYEGEEVITTTIEEINQEGDDPEVYHRVFRKTVTSVTKDVDGKVIASHSQDPVYFTKDALDIQQLPHNVDLRASQAAKKAEIALPHLADPIVSIKHVHEPSVGDYEITICHPWMCVDESIDDQEGYSVLAHGEKNKMMRKGKTPTTRTTTATATTFQDAHPGVTTSAAERRQNEHKRRYDAKIRQQKNQNQRALQDKMTGAHPKNLKDGLVAEENDDPDSLTALMHPLAGTCLYGGNDDASHATGWWTYEACFDVTVGIRQIHKELHLQPQSFTTTNADGSTTTVSVMSPTPAAAGGTSDAAAKTETPALAPVDGEGAEDTLVHPTTLPNGDVVYSLGYPSDEIFHNETLLQASLVRRRKNKNMGVDDTYDSIAAKKNYTLLVQYNDDQLRDRYIDQLPFLDTTSSSSAGIPMYPRRIREQSAAPQSADKDPMSSSLLIEFSGGTLCDVELHMQRQTTLELFCGSRDKIFSVVEDKTCHYHIKAYVKALCGSEEFQAHIPKIVRIKLDPITSAD